MTMLRRFLALLALMFWQGGFMFYGAVVVPVMRAQLEGMPQRSLITQRVTGWMNLAGTVALLLTFADLWTSVAAAKRWRWLAWACMTVPHLAVVWLHRAMSHEMAAPAIPQSATGSFAQLHWAYLLCNLIQLLAGLAFTVLTLRAWRCEDSVRLAGSSRPRD